MLLPTDSASLRRSLDQWFDDQGLHPRVQAEFDDSALLKVFGQDAVGLVPAPTAIEAHVARHYELEVVGRIDAVRERFFAISVERKIRHPSVLAICERARAVFAKDER